MITYSQSLELENTVYIDTRSPGEFELDRIPGATSIPIFNNEERAIVGTLYTRVGHDEAYDKGKDIYEKKIQEIKNKLSKYKDKKLIIYCWRGGLRSKTITELAVKTGLDAEQLNGGYKKYREYVRTHLEAFDLKPRLIIIHGLTGTGKTEVVNEFEHSIDLEGLAQHRSSVFGAIGLRPNTQKRFESLLLKELETKNHHKHLVVEGESRKIGNIIIPNFFFAAMKKGINIRLDAGIKERVNRLCSIYADTPEHIKLTAEKARKLKHLPKRKEMIELLENGNAEGFMNMILKEYYDPKYCHSLDEIKYGMEVWENPAAAILAKFDVQ